MSACCTSNCAAVPFRVQQLLIPIELEPVPAAAGPLLAARGLLGRMGIVVEWEAEQPRRITALAEPLHRLPAAWLAAYPSRHAWQRTGHGTRRARRHGLQAGGQGWRSTGPPRCRQRGARFVCHRLAALPARPSFVVFGHSSADHCTGGAIRGRPANGGMVGETVSSCGAISSRRCGASAAEASAVVAGGHQGRRNRSKRATAARQLIVAELLALHVLLDLQLQPDLFVALIHHHRFDAGPAEPPCRLQPAMAGDQLRFARDQDRAELPVTTQALHHRPQLTEVGADPLAHHDRVDTDLHSFVYRPGRSSAIRRA